MLKAIYWKLRASIRKRKRERALLKRMRCRLPGPPKAQGSKPRILIFTPEAGVGPHFHTSCIIGRTLFEAGHDVWMARCFEHLPRCPAKGASGVSFSATPPEQRQTCFNCASNSLKALDAYGLPVLNLDVIATPEVMEECASIQRHLPDQLEEFYFDDVAFGMMCGYEVRLSLKALALDPKDPEIRLAWVTLIMSAVKSYLMIKTAAKKFGFSNIIYFNDYSLFIGARLAMEKSGGQACMVSHAYNRGVDRRKWVFHQTLGIQAIFTVCLRWPTWREIPLKVELIEEITTDAIYRLSGQSVHTYSPPKSLQNSSERNRRKRVVAYTSSPDEAACFSVLAALGAKVPAWSLTFGSNLEDCHVSWLAKLCNFFRSREDLELIIRIHPREGANRRESNVSAHLLRLRQCLRVIPDNCRVIWPEDSFSSYDLGESADLVLTSWSTIGIEMARLGVPVLCCAKGVAGYPADDFQLFEASEDAYFQKIDELLGVRPRLETIQLAYRWWNLAFLANSIDFSDLIPASDFTDLPEFKLPRNHAILERTLLSETDIYRDAQARLTTGSKPLAEQIEAECLKRAMRRLIRFLFTGADDAADYKLRLIQDDRGTIEHVPPSLQNNDWVIYEHDKLLTLFFSGTKITRYSPMITRLAVLAATSFGTTEAIRQSEQT